MPDQFSILSGDEGFGVVVPDFSPPARRRAARILWEQHVGGGTPMAYLKEFHQLIKAGQDQIWRRYSIWPADPDDERWGVEGDLEDTSISVIWFLDEDIPDRYSWE